MDQALPYLIVIPVFPDWDRREMANGRMPILASTTCSQQVMKQPSYHGQLSRMQT